MDGDRFATTHWSVAMKPRWLFLFFLVSGFCSLVDEVVWLRLAMSSFGVTTPIVAMVLSIFMGGLALGSWGAGRLTRRLAGHEIGRASCRERVLFAV